MSSWTHVKSIEVIDYETIFRNVLIEYLGLLIGVC